MNRSDETTDADKHARSERLAAELQRLLEPTVLERDHAIEKLRNSEERLSAELADSLLLQKISARMIEQENAEGLYEEILDAAVAVMRSDFASMQMLHPERGSGGELRLLAFRGFNAEAARFWEWVRADSESTCGVALHTGERVIVADVTDCDFMAGTDDLASYLETGIRAVQSTPLFSRGGTLVGMLSTHWREPHAPTERDLRLFDILARQAADLIERRRSEAALRASEARYRGLFDSIDEGFCVVEVLFDDAGRANDYRFVEINPEFERQTGLRDALGRSMRELAPTHDEHWFEIYGEVARSGEPIRFVNSSTPLGRTFDVYAFRIGDPEERKVAILVKDVTERNAHIEALREADQRKDEFLATLAHELRNPLAPLRNCLHILDMDDDGKVDARHLHQVMGRQVAHLVRLVDDLLEVSRITRGRIVLRTEQVDLGQVVERAVETSLPLIESRHHALAIDLPAEPLLLEADPLRLAQVLSNLLNNAAKYTEPGGHIGLSVRREGDTAMLSVRDDGLGIAPEQRDRVFELFSQADRSLTRAQGGLGIGLTLARRLVELHGGSIEVHSDGIGHGSEFVVRLSMTIHV